MVQPKRVLFDLGVALREIRTDRRLSQEELGLRTGVHRNYLGGIERGERNPSVVTVARLADALEIPMGELFARADQVGAEEE